DLEVDERAFVVATLARVEPQAHDSLAERGGEADLRGRTRVDVDTVEDRQEGIGGFDAGCVGCTQTPVQLHQRNPAGLARRQLGCRRQLRLDQGVRPWV